ncbi:MAG: tetratricopeptide repeat protein [Endomicrobiia bacterium]
MSKYDVSFDAMRHYYRGRVFEATGELDIAIEEYKKAIEYGADYADVHNSLGKALAKKGFLEEARMEFEKALRLNPRYFEAQKNLNELLTKISILSKENKTISSQMPVDNLQIVKSHEAEIQHLQSLGFKLNFQIKNFLFIFGGIFVVSVGVLFFYKNFISKEKIPIPKIYDTTLETISSINKIDNKLVLSSWSSQEVAFYKMKGDFLLLVTSFKFAKDNIVPTSVCFISNFLYILDGWNKKIYKYAIIKNKNILLKVLDLSQIEPICIVAYRGNILVFNNKAKEVILYDKDLNRIVEKFSYLIKNTIYASSYKNKIWILDNDYNLYMLKGLKEISNSFKLSFLANKNISSFYIDNKFLWFSEEGSSQILNYDKTIIE